MRQRKYRKYQKWNTAEALAAASAKIAPLSRGEILEQKLFPEYMAIYRAKSKSRQLFKKLFSNLQLDNEILIEEILDIVARHEDKINISKGLIKGLTDFVDAFNREPKSSFTMPLSDFRNLCSRVAYAAGEYDSEYAHFRYDFILLECKKDNMKAEAANRKIFAVAKIPASTCDSGIFAIHKEDVKRINKLTGREITIEFLKKSMHISIDGKTVSDIPRPPFDIAHPVIEDMETPARTFLIGCKRNLSNCVEKVYRESR